MLLVMNWYKRRVKRTDKLLGAISLCRKAGKLAVGFDTVLAAVLRGDAQLVLLAQDVSAATEKRVMNACGGECKTAKLPYTQVQLAMVVRKAAGVLAVSDAGLAQVCQKALQEWTGNEEKGKNEANVGADAAVHDTAERYPETP